MLAKSPTVPADAVVFDLEDSVPTAEKAAARARVAARLRDWPTDAPEPYVRINPPRFGMLAEDAEALATALHVGIVVPKVDRPIELAAVFDALGRERQVVVNLETPRALLRAEDFADTPGVTGVFLGGEDLTSALGTRRTPEGDELAWARWMVLLAARAAGIDAFDTICPEFRDLTIVERDARQAAALGFDGKFAIHPAQLAVIHAAFTPDDAETAWARRVVEAFDGALAQGHAAVAVDGQMIDPPVAERARAVLRRAERAGVRG
jgi:citrate lyase subunit beta/citryl-CoA lyase